MVEQRWLSSRTMPSLDRRILPIVSALFLIFTLFLLLMVVVAPSVSSAGPALMETREQHQLDREKQAQQRQLEVTVKGCWLQQWRKWWWYSASGWDVTTNSAKRRRRLIGSSPLSCRFRCGRCAPCRVVSVPIQPGKSSPLEYYPEAWMCQCGNKLFMP